MLSLGSVALTAPGTVSSDQMVSSIFRRASGNYWSLSLRNNGSDFTHLAIVIWISPSYRRWSHQSIWGYHESLSHTTSVANGTNTFKTVSTSILRSPPLTSLSSNTGELLSLSSTYPGMGPVARPRMTWHSRSGQDELTVNELRADGRNPLVWRHGPGRVARTPVGTLWTTTGMIPIGGNCWDFVSHISASPALLLLSHRQIAGEESPTLARLEQVPTRSRNFDICQLLRCGYCRVAQDARCI